MRVERYDRRMRSAFSGLAHPGLPDQIREALRPGHSIPVRQMAFSAGPGRGDARTAAGPRCLRVQPRRAGLPARRRRWALKDYADEDTRVALVPLATERIEDDEDDEIKGQALSATFPFPLGVADVLPVLTPARNEASARRVQDFVSRSFPKALRPEDLQRALDWARTVPRDHGATDLLASLTDDVLAAAWSHLDDERIRAAVVAVIKPRLIAHHELLGPLHDSDDRRTFLEQRGRRLLIGDLMREPVAGEIDPHWLALSKPRSGPARRLSVGRCAASRRDWWPCRGCLGVSWPRGCSAPRAATSRRCSSSSERSSAFAEINGVMAQRP